MIPILYTTDSSKGPRQHKGPHSASSRLEAAQGKIPGHERGWRELLRGDDDDDDVRCDVWQLKEKALVQREIKVI